MNIAYFSLKNKSCAPKVGTHLKYNHQKARQTKWFTLTVLKTKVPGPVRRARES